MSWKVNSEKIAKRHNIQTFDKLTYEQAKEIGKMSDAIVIGSKIIGFIETSINSKKIDTNKMFNEISKFEKWKKGAS